MGDEPVLSLESLEKEEARLRARLAKVVAAKELLSELSQPSGHAILISSEPTQPLPVEARAKAPEPGPYPWQIEIGFDHTFAGLVKAYRTHENSPYRKLKHKVRVNYDHSLNRLVADIGPERIDTFNAHSVQRVYDEKWSAGGKLSMGHTMIAKLRLLCTFGSTILHDNACTLLSAVLGNMRFAAPKGRRERLTREHVRVIRAVAREQFGWNSIALATAMQFEFTMLRQVDIIGEWVPLSEPGTSDITKENEKWLHGLRWSDIDESMILRREMTSGRKNQQKTLELDLKHCAMTMEELNRVPPWQRQGAGAVVVCEFSGLPWSAAEFRRKWRIVADKAGIPANIRSTDGADEELGAAHAL